MIRAYEDYLADLPDAARSWIGASIMIGAMLAMIVTLLLKGAAAPVGAEAKRGLAQAFGWIGMIVAAAFGVLLAWVGVLHAISEFNARGFRPRSIFGDGVVPVGCAIASIGAIASTALQLLLTRWERDHVPH